MKLAKLHAPEHDVAEPGTESSDAPAFELITAPTDRQRRASENIQTARIKNARNPDNPRFLAFCLT
ncbi:hypothetical protein ACIGB6_11785 [Paeniglutamicibacter gangotriensis]|uniref:hypothetical protein n=1 Tax=Paeniglutamicibacter gangotriensis TaxID=254787 RepID=UPI0037C86BB5